MNSNAIVTPYKCEIYQGHMDKNVIALIDSERHFISEAKTLFTGCVISKNV